MSGAAAAERAGVHRRVGPGGRRDRLGRAGAAARDRQRHHLRHGRHDRQGLDGRGRRSAGLHGGVRGRRPASRCSSRLLERRRLRAERAVHRPRRGRRRRRQHRLARPGGAPKVGPHSAGAVPGSGLLRPGRRRSRPSPTPTSSSATSTRPRSGRRHAARRRRARSGSSQEQVAGPLGLSLLDAAYGVHQLANASMIRAVKAVSSQRGRDPRDFTLFAFGGSGPIHAAGIARELEIRRVVVPPRARLLLGLRPARGRSRASRHADVPAAARATLDPAELDARFDELEAARARAELRPTTCARSQFAVRALGRDALRRPGIRAADVAAAHGELQPAWLTRSKRRSRPSTSGPTATAPAT